MTASWWHLRDFAPSGLPETCSSNPSTETPPPPAESTKGFSDMEGKTMHIYDCRRWSGTCTVMVNMYCDWLLTHGWLRLQYCIVCMCCMYSFWNVYFDALCATNVVLSRGQSFWRLCTVGMHKLVIHVLISFSQPADPTKRNKSNRFLHEP